MTTKKDPAITIDLEELKRMLDLVESRGLAGLEVREPGRVIVITAVREGGSPTPLPALTQVRPRRQLPKPHSPELDAGLIPISSPTLGVFYRAPSPDDEPMVEVGAHVEVGQAVGILEAMKVFSEIPTDHAGTVTQILVGNGDLVQAGQPLIYLKPEG